MKKYITLFSLLVSGIVSADVVNLSPEFEKFLKDTSRIMSKEGRKDFNTHINYLKKEYKKAKKAGLIENCDYVVATYDLSRRSGAGNNTTGFSKSKPGFYRIEGDNEDKDVFFVTEDELIDDDGKTIRFQREDNEYVSNIYWKTEERKKKERDERKSKKKKK